ncbi:hypothetical protein ACI2KD_11660 [Pseudomonas monteilii]
MQQDENGLYKSNDGARHTTQYHALKHDEESYRESLNHGLRPAELKGKLAQIVVMFMFLMLAIFLLEQKAYFLFLLMIPIAITAVAVVHWCVKRIPPFIRLFLMIFFGWFALYAGNGGWWK